MTIWLTSDQHINHDNIIKFCDRPFTDIYHQTAVIVNNWNEVVENSDTVYVLGDFAMGDKQKSLDVLKRLTGRKVLISGNHDNCHPMHSTTKTRYDYWVGQYQEAFDEVLGIEALIENGQFRLSHMPYRRDRGKDYQGRDFSEWEPVDDGIPLFCGHVHESWCAQKTKLGTSMINVGVDQWNFFPVALETLKSYLDVAFKLVLEVES